jgi:hypothetical protein
MVLVAKAGLLAVAILGSSGLAALAEESGVLAGSGTLTVVSNKTVPLPNGATLYMLSVEGETAGATSETPNFFVTCDAMALKDADGEWRAQGYCTARENETDAYVFKIDEELGSGVAEIVGGSGRWEGITGSGTHQWTDAKAIEWVSYDYEDEYRLP